MRDERLFRLERESGAAADLVVFVGSGGGRLGGWRSGPAAAAAVVVAVVVVVVYCQAVGVYRCKNQWYVFHYIKVAVATRVQSMIVPLASRYFPLYFLGVFYHSLDSLFVFSLAPTHTHLVVVLSISSVQDRVISLSLWTLDAVSTLLVLLKTQDIDADAVDY